MKEDDGFLLISWHPHLTKPFNPSIQIPNTRGGDRITQGYSSDKGLDGYSECWPGGREEGEGATFFSCSEEEEEEEDKFHQHEQWVE